MTSFPPPGPRLMRRNLHPNPSLLPRPGCRHLVYEPIRDNLEDMVYTAKAGVLRICLLGRGQTELEDQYLAFKYTEAPDQPLPHLSLCVHAERNPHHTPTAARDVPTDLQRPGQRALSVFSSP